MIRQDNSRFNREGVPGLNNHNRLAQQRYGFLVREDLPAVVGDHGEEEGATWSSGAAVFHS